jgi:hypothetical protein
MSPADEMRRTFKTPQTERFENRKANAAMSECAAQWPLGGSKSSRFGGCSVLPVENVFLRFSLCRFIDGGTPAKSIDESLLVGFHACCP